MAVGQFLTNWGKPALFVVLLLPLGGLLWNAADHALGANPVETIIHQTGLWTLRLLLLTLVITPLRNLSGWVALIRLRRMIGLFSFFYATLHFASYAWLDQGLVLNWIVEDVVERPYITVGFAVYLMLLPLAVTSTNAMMRRLGRRWKQLHRLVYACAAGAIVHFLWVVKADTREPLVYLALLCLLLAARLPRSVYSRMGARWHRPASDSRKHFLPQGPDADNVPGVKR